MLKANTVVTFILSASSVFLKKDIRLSNVLRFFFKYKFILLLILISAISIYGYIQLNKMYQESVFTNANFVKTLSLDLKNATSNQIGQALHYCQNKDVYKIDTFACNFLEQKEILRGDG